jgi:hypothetical protein
METFNPGLPNTKHVDSIRRCPKSNEGTGARCDRRGRSIGDKPPQSLGAKDKMRVEGRQGNAGKVMTSQIERLQLEHCARKKSMYRVV